MTLLRFLFTIAILTLATRARAETAPPLLEKATTAFQLGSAALTSNPNEAAAHFRQSAVLYRQAIEAMHADHIEPSASVMYNLGNASFLAGDNGQAVLWYKRAERHAPSDANIQANLAKAREKIGARTPEATGIIHQLAIIEVVSPAARFWIASAAFAIMWLLALLRLFPVAFTPPRLLIGAAGLMALLAGATLVPRELRLRDRAEAVVTAPEITARAGPDDATYEPRPAAPLKGGTELRIVESRGDWLLVTLPDATQTWVNAPAVERVHP